MTTPTRPDGRQLDAYRSCRRKVRYADEERATRAAELLGLCIYPCDVCGGFHVTKSAIGGYVAEVYLKDFLRRHGFRHDGDHDRGAYWTNGAGRVMVAKSYQNKNAELRQLMDQIRALAKKKQLIADAAAKQDAEKLRQLQKMAAAAAPPKKEVYSPKALIDELTRAGKPTDYIAQALNAQGIKHPAGRQWDAAEVDEFSGKPRPPQTPEEHHVAQATAPEPEEEAPVTGKKRVVKKLIGEERIYVFGRLKALISQRATDEQIAAALTSEGAKQGNGRMIDATWVAGRRYMWAQKPELPKKYAAILVPRTRNGTAAPVARAAPIPEPEVQRARFGLPRSVDVVLSDREVGDAERLQILFIFVDVPEAAKALLQDEKLTVAQKLAVIEAVGIRKGKQ